MTVASAVMLLVASLVQGVSIFEDLRHRETADDPSEEGSDLK